MLCHILYLRCTHILVYMWSLHYFDSLSVLDTMWCLTLILEKALLLLFLKQLLPLFFLISSLLWHMIHLLYVYHSLFLNIQSWVFFDTLSTCYFSGKLLVFLQAHWCFTHALSMKQSNNPSSFLPLWSGFPVLPLILSQSFCVLVNLCSYSLSTFFPARTLIIQPFLF